MAKFNVTLGICHDALSWRETRHFETHSFTFETVAEIQAFIKEKYSDRSLPTSGGHYFTIVRDGALIANSKYAYWPNFFNGNYDGNEHFN